jgi:predicted pyridoxine 5'-phosphate oxidase superfamily flavin-nucleotide-binding protein
VTVDPGLLASFAVEGKTPRSVVVIAIDEVYFQCARAIIRAELWNPARHVEPKGLPTPGDILAGMSEERVGGGAYDREWPERARKSMW